MPKRSSKGRSDLNTLAANIVQQATGQISQEEESPQKNPAAVALGRLGGLKGGKARAAKLSKSRRLAISKKAARARWRRHK